MYIISARRKCEMMPRLATFLMVSIVAAFPAQAGAAAAGPVSEDVPVPGGTAAMARSLGIDPTPDRARFVPELARLTHQASEDRNTTRAKAAWLLQRRNAGAAAADAGAESVPIPLTVAAWSQSVFHRPVAPEQIVSRDPRRPARGASLLRPREPRRRDAAVLPRSSSRHHEAVRARRRGVRRRRQQPARASESRRRIGR